MVVPKVIILFVFSEFELCHFAVLQVYVHYLTIRLHFLYLHLQMGFREKVGVFDYQSENNQGILIHILVMNLVR